MGKEHSLAQTINAYWRARGREANARMVTCFHSLGNGIAIEYQIVVSDLVNGWPQGRPFQ
jgi:hypothetical protein